MSWPAVLLYLAMVAPAASTNLGGQATDAEALRSLAQDTVSESRFQRTFPNRDSAQEQMAAENSRRSSGRRSARRRADARLPAGHHGGSLILHLLFWIALGALLVILALWISREIRTLHMQSLEIRGSPGESQAADGAEAPATVDEAEALAAAGDYGRAIHALLAHVFASLKGAGTVAIDSSTTGREVMRSAPADAGFRRDLTLLVVAVEEWLFGGMPMVVEDFSRCRSAHRQLMAHLESGA